MASQKFKTTINCANCVRAVTPLLNAESAITHWAVDTASPDKVLTVEGAVAPARVVAVLTEAGFEAEPVG